MEVSNVPRRPGPRFDPQGFVSTAFQPIVHLHTGKVVGYEALLRGPAGSALACPGRIFGTNSPISPGLIQRLDAACVAAALRSGRLLVPMGLLFINVHLHTLLHMRDLQTSYLRLMESSGIPPEAVVIEISERSRSATPRALSRILRDMRKRGFSLRAGRLRRRLLRVAALALVRAGICEVGQGLRPRDRPVRQEANPGGRRGGHGPETRRQGHRGGRGKLHGASHSNGAGCTHGPGLPLWTTQGCRFLGFPGIHLQPLPPMVFFRRRSGGNPLITIPEPWERQPRTEAFEIAVESFPQECSGHLHNAGFHLGAQGVFHGEELEIEQFVQIHDERFLSPV